MFKTVTTLALSAALCGCAVTESTVHIPYTATSASSDPRLASIHVAVDVTDARLTNRGRIGTKMNGYGMEMAAIRTDDDIAKDVEQALKAELEHRGYALLPGAARIDVAVTAFYSQFATGFWAGRADGRAEMMVRVKSPTGVELYSRDLHGLDQLSVASSSGANAARSISGALTKAMASLFNDTDFTHALVAAQAGGPSPPS